MKLTIAFSGNFISINQTDTESASHPYQSETYIFLGNVVTLFLPFFTLRSKCDPLVLQFGGWAEGWGLNFPLPIKPYYYRNPSTFLALAPSSGDKRCSYHYQSCNPFVSCGTDTLAIKPLSPNIHIQILQTDLYIFP